MKPPIEELVESQAKRLYAAAFNICGNTQDAEDAVQETFIAYLTKNKEFENPAHVQAWLTRVAINHAKNKTRSFWRKHRVSLDTDISSDAFPTSEAFELFDAVMRLPENLRIVIHLFYYDGYSVREISNILQLSESNVKVRLSRGRSALRNFFKEDPTNDRS